MTLENNVISSFSFSFFLSFFYLLFSQKKQNLTLEMKSTGLRTTRMLCASIFYRPRAIVLPLFFFFFFIYIFYQARTGAFYASRRRPISGGKKEKEKKKKRKRKKGRREKLLGVHADTQCVLHIEAK